MEMNNVETMLAGGAGGITVTGFLFWSVRRMFRQYSTEITEKRKDEAEAALFTNLRAEITRMGEDILKIKEAHRQEKHALDRRIEALEHKVATLNGQRNRTKQIAVDGYRSCAKGSCQHQPDTLGKFNQIIDHGDPNKEWDFKTAP
ncbi:hypothetical protein F6R98_10570 [Candidatus Methylospira mobilis]|uniref:Uncharacterized protein n=1 Tax=Candidatus Methylospira mobilis TaxID=1808979 RepID=A0A5Q0BGQ1_9GAMM|nr:hypothetical protein [Candidatus Methylospira mobilis]QFY43003.1 hypothetical protein F6R98_10570 [Candidatus Methylospira mobilis]